MGYLTQTTLEMRLYRSYKLGAASRDYEWGLTIDEFAELIYQPCHYCGIVPLTNSTGLECNGIDRKDNGAGYIAGNVLPCCTSCNQMKGTLTYSQFVARAYCIAARLPVPSDDEIKADSRREAQANWSPPPPDSPSYRHDQTIARHIQRLEAQEAAEKTATIRSERLERVAAIRETARSMTDDERIALARQLRAESFTLREIRFAIRAKMQHVMAWTAGVVAGS